MTRKSRLTWATCLLGLAISACALPAEPAEPADDRDPSQAPVSTSAPVEAAAEPWQPSEEWLDLYNRDQSIQTLLAEAMAAEDPQDQADLLQQAYEEELALRDYLVQNPGADAPCEVWAAWAPPELWAVRSSCATSDL